MPAKRKQTSAASAPIAAEALSPAAQRLDTKSRAEGETNWTLTRGTRPTLYQGAATRWEYDAQLALGLAQSNPLARALADIPANWLFGEGVTVVAPDNDAAQEALDRWWYDPSNNMSEALPRMMREVTVTGECALAVEAMNGVVRYARVPSTIIDRVRVDPENSDVPVIAILRGPEGRYFDYQVLNSIEIPVSEVAMEARDDAIGDIVLFQQNRPVGASRGVSDFAPVLEWLQLYSKLLKLEVARISNQVSFSWDVGVDDSVNVKARLDEIMANPPTSGAVNVHSNTETWTTIAPDLGGTEAAEAARIFRNHILSAMQIPEYVLGGGGDVNRATAVEMGQPFYKSLLAKQRMWTGWLKFLAKQVVPEGTEIEVQWPSLAREDHEANAETLEKTVSAAQTALASGLISRDAAIRLVATASARAGVEYDADDVGEPEDVEDDRAQARDGPPDTGQQDGGSGPQDTGS